MEREKELHIICQIRNGQRECYKELVDAYSAPVFSFIKGIVKNYEDAQDLAQEVFVKGFFSLGKYRGESSFFSWIYRIAYNEAISFIRKKNKKSAIHFIDNLDYDAKSPDLFLLELEGDGVYLKLEQEKKYGLLQKAIGELPPEEQFLLTQFYYKNSSIKQLEEITGLTESNIKIKLFRTKKKLAEQMIKQQKAYGNK